MTKRFRLISLGALALGFSFSSFYVVSRAVINEQSRVKPWTRLFFAMEGVPDTANSFSSISTRRVCSAALSRRGAYVFDVNPEDVEVRLYSSNKADPQVIPSTPHLLRDLMNEGRLKVDLSEVDDGNYQLLLCHKKHACDLPASWKNQNQLRAQLNQYGDELRREYARQEQIGFRHYSQVFEYDSATFRALRQELLTSSRGILGGIPQLTVRSGSIVQPRQSLLVRPHRLTTRSPQTKTFTNQLPVGPQLIVAWKMEDTRANKSRNRTQAPSPDGCYETASFLTVDLQGRGLRVGSILDGLYQDLYHDGTMQRVAWPQGTHSAFIAWHDAQSGTVVPIDHLTALRAWDSDYNGQLNHQDQLPEQLGLWQDLDQNGSLAAEEWRPFREAIQSIDLHIARTYEEDRAGNRVEAQARIRLQNGSVRAVAELYPRHF